MGKHKPRRPKKKKNKPIKTIELSFDTKKNSYKSFKEVFDAKHQLIDLSSLEEIEAALDSHNMPVDRETMINEYEKCYKIEDIINNYHQKYNKQLDILSSKSLIFDDDCFILYLEKLIKTNYKTWQLPDPDLIFDELDQIEDHKPWEQFNIYLEMVKALNKMKAYNDSSDLNAIFSGSYWDVETVLSDTLMNARNIALDFIDEKEKIIEFSNEVFSLLDTYKLEDPAFLYSDVCDLLGILGYDAVKEKYEEGLKRYPYHEIRLHNILLFITYFTSKETHKYQDFIDIYEKVMTTKPKNEAEKEQQELIKNNFEKEYLEFKSRLKG